MGNRLVVLLGRDLRLAASIAAAFADITLAFALAEENGDRRIHLDAFGSGFDEDLADPALVDGLDLHGRLVGLDLGDDVAWRDLVTDILDPFGECAFLHRRRKSGHQDFGWHVRPSP